MRGVLLLSSVLLAGCGGSDRKAGAPGAAAPAGAVPPDAPVAEQATPETVAELLDHPERFKGKSLRVRLTVDSPIFAREGEVLGAFTGQAVRFRAPGERGTRPAISVGLPTSIHLPVAHHGDELLVTFRCGEGSLTAGNRASRVERPGE